MNKSRNWWYSLWDEWHINEETMVEKACLKFGDHLFFQLTKFSKHLLHARQWFLVHGIMKQQSKILLSWSVHSHGLVLGAWYKSEFVWCIFIKIRLGWRARKEAEKSIALKYLLCSFPWKEKRKCRLWM